MKKYVKWIRSTLCVVLVLVFSLLFSVTAFATGQYIDPYKYITSIESNGNIETVHILFNGVQPLHRLVAAGNDFTTVSDVTFAVTPGVTTAAIASWQNGVISSDNQPAPDGAIRVAEIMSGTTMVIKSDFGFSWDHSSSRVGGSFDWSYQCFVRCYDANGNYMTKIGGERLSGTESMAGSSTVTRDYEYSFVLPSGCTFICPSSNFTMYPRITSEDEWRVDFIYHSDYFGMSITRDTLAAGSQNNQAVLDKMDDIISGGTEGGNLENKGNQISGAGAGMKDQISDIQKFEDQHFANLDNNMGSIMSAANVNGIASPLGFVTRYVNLAVSAIPQKYMAVFTLPLFLGIFFFMVMRPVKVPRVSKDGD